MRKAILLSLALAALCSTSCTHHSRRGYDRDCVAMGHKGHLLADRFAPSHHRELIIIDPGHGGHDSGARGKGSIEEKNLALATALMLKNQLHEMGFEVQMTRDRDLYLPLTQRADMANTAKCSVFVSVHFNASENGDAYGVEVFYYGPEKPGVRERESQSLAKLVLGHICAYTSAKPRGAKGANFSVLRRTDMPAILVEGGFVTNPTELQKLKEPYYLNLVARGIAEGVNDYISKQQ